MTDNPNDQHVMPRTHDASSNCWCSPRVDDGVPHQSGARVWIHASDAASELATLTTDRDRLRGEVEALTNEVKAMREALIHVCGLQHDSFMTRREIWAVRQAANKLSAPFSIERWQAEYDAIGERDDVIEKLNTALARVEAERDWQRDLAAERERLLAPLKTAFAELAAERDTALRERNGLHDALTSVQRVCAGRTATIDAIASAMSCQPDDDADLVEAVRLLVSERDTALAAAEKMRPVYEAALEWRAGKAANMLRLANAIDAATSGGDEGEK